MSLTGKDKEIYLNGLRRFRDKGIDIYVDGMLADEDDWAKVIRDADDEASSFYMGDYIEEKGLLKEIRFDKVNNNNIYGEHVKVC